MSFFQMTSSNRVRECHLFPLQNSLIRIVCYLSIYHFLQAISDGCALLCLVAVALVSTYFFKEQKFPYKQIKNKGNQLTAFVWEKNNPLL